MIGVLAVVLILVLTAIAVLHLYWGFGGFWPGSDNDTLVGLVVGLPAGTPMPPLWACVAVALCLAVPVIALVLITLRKTDALPLLLRWIPKTALWFCVIVFVGRGLATYVGAFDGAKATAFYELNRTIYSPLCLALGLGLVIVLMG